MKQRHKPSQHEFGGEVTTGFRLLTETTLDGERAAREAAQREADRAEAERQQPPLFSTDS
ncbi:MAG TPA: hypothetical protein VMB21_11210 [Candidatus Limnocylindria bacterium]|jgi:hypothetical protein|nr:hypothetical protein [Candidatus Limnocylindria bacterium]